MKSLHFECDYSSIPGGASVNHRRWRTTDGGLGNLELHQSHRSQASPSLIFLISRGLQPEDITGSLKNPTSISQFSQLKLRLSWWGGSHGVGNETITKCVGNCTLERTFYGTVGYMASTSLREIHGVLHLRNLQPSAHCKCQAECNKTVSLVHWEVTKAHSSRAWEPVSPATDMLERIHPRIFHILFISASLGTF